MTLILFQIDPFNDPFSTNRPIDTVSKLVFWSHLVNKLEPWHIFYIMQQ